MTTTGKKAGTTLAKISALGVAAMLAGAPVGHEAYASWCGGTGTGGTGVGGGAGGSGIAGLAFTFGPGDSGGTGRAGRRGAGPGGGETAESAESFAGRLLQMDLFEINVARVANDKVVDGSVRQLASHTIESHTDLLGRLQGIAGDQVPPWILPTTLSAADWRTIVSFRAQPADKHFDRTYTAFELMRQRQARALLTSYAEDGGNEALRQHVVERLAALERNAALAERAESALKMASAEKAAPPQT